MKNKKLRAFYEDQNQRLDDWLEVDTIVRYLSDDIVDSFDPQDEDGDGVREQRGALHYNQESIEPFLPQEEQEKRKKARQYTKWAINVSHCSSLL